MGRATAFILPCKRAENGDIDGIPVALMEAMATETPPISTTVSGIPELISDEKSGLLVEPSDVSELATAIETVLRDECLAETIGRNARQRVLDEFTVDKQVNRLLIGFKEAIDAR
jgi:glycosyltransferase involved in cell wall biosynthesis